jgi:hypothetical protein
LPQATADACDYTRPAQCHRLIPGKLSMLARMTAPHSPSIVRVAVDSRSPALALAAQFWPEAERESQLAAIEQLVADSGASALILLAAGSAAVPAAAVLAQLLPGKSAVVWPPQLTPGVPGEIAPALLRALDEHLARADVVLAQVLLENPDGAAAATLGSRGLHSCWRFALHGGRSGNFSFASARA